MLSGRHGDATERLVEGFVTIVEHDVVGLVNCGVGGAVPLVPDNLGVKQMVFLGRALLSCELVDAILQ